MSIMENSCEFCALLDSYVVGAHRCERPNCQNAQRIALRLQNENGRIEYGIFQYVGIII